MTEAKAKSRPTERAPWDEAEIEGRTEDRDCAITYRRDGRKLATALIHRDLEGLHAEVEFERRIAAGAAARANRPDARESVTA